MDINKINRYMYVCTIQNISLHQSYVNSELSPTKMGLCIIINAAEYYIESFS